MLLSENTFLVVQLNTTFLDYILYRFEILGVVYFYNYGLYVFKNGGLFPFKRFYKIRLGKSLML